MPLGKRHRHRKGFFMNVIRYLLLVCLVFLQSGFSYYISFQVLGLVLVACAIFSVRYEIRLSFLGIVSFFIFMFFVAYTAFVSPLVISRNSTNIGLTLVALIFYATAIFSLSLIRFKRPHRLLLFIRHLSSSLILALLVILIVSELSFLPFLSREVLALQNIGLIDNATSISDYELSISMNQFSPKVDLFYGEPSFLAVVLMASSGSAIIAGRALVLHRGAMFEPGTTSIYGKIIKACPYLGILMLVYIQSLSSIMYAFVTLYFVFSSRESANRISWKELIIYAISGLLLVGLTFSYLVARLSMEVDLSFVQRFSFLFNMGWLDFLIGIKDVSKLPEVGIHNGAIYLIVISGVGGFFYLLHLVQYAYRSGQLTGLGWYTVILVFAITMQNGGIFTPSKIVLFALVLLPLAALRSGGRKALPTISAGVIR